MNDHEMFEGELYVTSPLYKKRHVILHVIKYQMLTLLCIIFYGSRVYVQYSVPLLLETVQSQACDAIYMDSELNPEIVYTIEILYIIYLACYKRLCEKMHKILI